jgi:mono/diheme cytochrome c family protein
MMSMMSQRNSTLALLPLLFATAVCAQAGSASKASIQAGQQIFLQRCMQCHSTNEGQVMVGPSLWGEMNKSPHHKTAAEVRAQIHDGKGKMPAFKDILTKQDTDDLIAYIRSL